MRKIFTEEEKAKSIVDYRKRFNVITEYIFDLEKDDEKDKDDDKDLLLGQLPEAEEDETNPDDANAPNADPNAQQPVPRTPDANAPQQPPVDPNAQPQPDANMQAQPVPEPIPEPAPAPVEQPSMQDDTVEVDITELVKGNEETKSSVDLLNKRTEDLFKQMEIIGKSVENMEMFNKKIEDLEKEIKTRNPTPVEKLEMASLDTFPYNLKVTDYFASKGDSYEITDRPKIGDKLEDEEDKQEFELTDDIINSDYNEQEIKKSFHNYDKIQEEVNRIKQLLK